MTGLQLNQTQLAETFGVNRSAIRTWDQRGCPSTGSGRAKRYDSEAVIEWYVQQKAGRSTKSELDELKLAELKAKTALLQIEVDQKSGELLRADDVRQALADEYKTIRTRLLNLPAKIAPAVAHMEDPAEVQAALRDEVVAALEALSDEVE